MSSPADSRTGDAAERAFVHSLAAPLTWHELALGGWLDDPEFRRYLRMLQRRWSAPAAAASLERPLALQLLQALFDTPAPAGGADDVPYREDVVAGWKLPSSAAAQRTVAACLVPPTAPLLPKTTS